MLPKGAPFPLRKTPADGAHHAVVRRHGDLLAQQQAKAAATASLYAVPPWK
jgi:hypothetical protein